ncbi:MAG: flavin reductase family protein [Rhodobacteraceae bacterium]|nr:flavin reductase family protein [Paracoccaceae bacterium]
MNAMTSQSSTFDPASGDPRAFRTALGRFGTGITVVTCTTPTGPLGMTANSFASVSLDPPLVLWSPAKSSSRYPFFKAADHFAIHVMGEDQQDICSGFARSADAFAGLDQSLNDHGVPLINGCLSRFECQKTAEHDGGDHTIIVARVTRVTTRPGKPLLFVGGTYGGFDTAS